MQFVKKFIDSIEIYRLAYCPQSSGHPVGNGVGIDQRSKDDSASVLGYFFIFLKKLFLYVGVFGLLGC